MIVLFRYIGGLLVLLATLCCQAQERVINLKDVYTVVDLWTEALNQKDLTTLSGLYADEVIFYAKKLPRVSCLGIKSKRLHSAKFFHQEIPKQPLVKVYDSGIIRASFVKVVTSGGQRKSYDAYLLLKWIDGELRIVGESDLIADGEAKYVPDVGKELKVSLLSESKLRVGDPVEYDEEHSSLNSNLVEWIAFGALLAVMYIVFRMVRGEVRSKEHQLKTSDLKEHEDYRKAQKAVDDGLAFERFIVGRFKPQYFKLLEWTSDKMIDGIYARSALNPDLHYEFRFGNFSKQFAMECKYRRVIRDGKFKLDQRQLENYRRYGKERNIQVYIALGVGGKPEAPKELYILPLQLFEASSDVDYELVRDYYNNPEKKFFLDTSTGELTWFRNPGY